MTMNADENSPEDRKNARQLLTILGMFRNISGEMPIQQMQVLVWVALNEGKTQRDLRATLNMASSTSSRSITALSKVHRPGKEGAGLIEFKDDPLDRRAKLLTLTPKGRTFMQQALEILS